MNERKRGFLLVLGTALISGFSIFVNSFAIAQFDPFVFTALKNSVVAIFIISLLFLLSRVRELARMGNAEWAKLAVWGAVDGGIAFLLYFYGMKLTNAASASLLQKSMFIFASALAVVILKERINWKQLVACIVVLCGAALLSGASYTMGVGEVAMLGAVLLWAAGNVIGKKLLERITPLNVAFGRMFFGSLLMLCFLTATGNAVSFSSFTANHYIWLLLTSALLLAYQLTYFNGLAVLNVSEATSMLVLGAVVTSLLSAFVMKMPTPAELLGMAAVAGGLTLIYLAPSERNVPNKTLQSC
jgi:drug/metabolite transporter (DMT)-like permease